MNIKIIAIGDSITYGYPYDPEKSWVALAAEKLNLNLLNKGINGDTTDGMLHRFNKDVLHYKPSHVIILGGTNDAYHDTGVDRVVHNIEAMTELAFKNNITPFIGRPIPCNEAFIEVTLGIYRDRIKEFALNNDLGLIDFHEALIDESGFKIKPELHYDGLHPSIPGYQKMADTAIAFLRKSFAINNIERISKPSKSDYLTLIDLWEDSVRATHHFITEKDIHFYKPLILNQYFDAVDLFCYKDETGKIIGFMGIVDDKLEMLFIHPDKKGMGIGKNLLNYAIVHHHINKVDVNEQNNQAVDFYKHMGFVIKIRSDLDGCGKNYPILSMELANKH
jgi:lysophospholipase L1-like esterase/GNAT superfamily N-acetyltransferase